MRDFGEIGFEIFEAFALAAVILAVGVSDVEIAQALRQAVVIVDDGDGLDAATARGFEFGQMIEETAIAADANHRFVGCCALRAE